VLKGTNLQLRVWAALLRIPAGTTTSYGSLAASIGSPRAVRAVANAVAANRVGVLVPCHRVLREDGTISGYAWGPDRKRAILARERALATAGAGPATAPAQRAP
jgi:AraC family transcriptional regulator of adaptative response/methylated-DNA-[protein]-cysteine methyltransferase